MGFISNFWQSLHGKHLSITATSTFACTLAFVFAIFHLAFMQDVEGWEDFTGTAIAISVFSGLGLFITAPEFIHLKGQSNLINELMEITSIAELRRRQSEGDNAANELGGGHEIRWSKYLVEKGLKKRR